MSAATRVAPLVLPVNSGLQRQPVIMEQSISVNHPKAARELHLLLGELPMDLSRADPETPRSYLIFLLVQGTVSEPG